VPGNPAGGFLLLLGSLGLVAAYGELLRRHPSAFNAVMALGGASWLVGNALWLAGRPVFLATPWWVGFLVFTIAGERLELSRLLPRSPGKRVAFFAALAFALGGLGLSAVLSDAGLRLFGAGLLALALWLGWFDIARRTVRKPGLGRFVAVCLLLGYAWLALGGIFLLEMGAVPAGPAYDAWLHSVLLGFAFSMIFGHAPIIFPALLRVRMVFRPWFYAHLILLHLSLLVRVAGDLLGSPPWRLWGGLGNGAAIALFLALTARSVWLGARLERARNAARREP